ncbi:zinc-binding alcohol dehydrogenase family protein [Enterococcus termitis]|uniref:Zinc-type alcohol dehydrogenase-like protein n=1 Tax=Enterococcus termitis TaxID=332950 RepID=A0A1E5H460_9ENTE|nr:zinc-binding alcohol dehydrogenase family protein [Enterococcus termitis]OEG19713.1 NADPH:quinone reductase [Enterococcus termitis]OJG97036.1 zinc-binding alcohol dehydrogenase [Enterococcus termitis]
MTNTDFIKAVGFYEGLPLEEQASFVDAYSTVPNLEPRDILVKVKAVSINPVDTKLRQTAKKKAELTVLGFDGVGEVVAIGENVEKFSVGDRVFYAGTTKRAGSNQEYQRVDERIVALAPKGLSDEAAAALPLTALTAYELLFEKFALLPKENANRGKTILVINAAGGVGSILTQLAKWAGLTVYGTASLAKFNWLEEHGVDHSIDYHQDIKEALAKIGVTSVDYSAVLFDVRPYFDLLVELLAPFGHLGTIVGLDSPIDIACLKDKSISFDWEYMFAKTDYAYRLESQGEILALVAKLMDQGKLTSTLSKSYKEGINAVSLKQATAEVESGHMQGKVVVSGPFNGSIQASSMGK